MDKRLIEEGIPIKTISRESSREKSIRHGHISTLHLWWSRKPLASSRSIIYASLVPEIGKDKNWIEIDKFFEELCKWKNPINEKIIKRVKDEIFKNFNGKVVKILDPFAGGGSIPLEAIRFGCETYSNDYNPVAVLIEKCTLEFPQKYDKNLILDFEKMGDWVLKKTIKELDRFYQIKKERREGYFGGYAQEVKPVGYLWVRTIKCENPTCEAEIPLLNQFWLAKKRNKKISLYPNITNKDVEFKVVGDGYEKFPEDFDPNKGTISNAIVNCLVCGSTLKAKKVRKQFQQGIASEKIIIVIFYNQNEKGKKYRLANENDISIFSDAEKFLEVKVKYLRDEWGIEPVPDEPIHTPDNKEYQPGNLLYNFTPVVLYGMTKRGDLFNNRQKLALIVFANNIKLAYNKMLNDGYDKEYAKCITAYLSCAMSRIVDQSSNLVRWIPQVEAVASTFSRQALSMVWRYVEANPFTYFKNSLEWIKRVIKYLSQIDKLPNNEMIKITNCSASELPYESNFFDAIITDPPYYDNIPYADLSDFFYVWLKRIIGAIFPSLFSTPLTPKSKEVLAELPLLRGMNKIEAAKIVKGIKTSKYFEDLLKNCFKEISRVLKPNGIAVIVYAHKTTKGWETVINALIDSGLTITASWPLSTERRNRPRAIGYAALTSSIYIIARKIKKENIGFYSEMKKALNNYLNEKLEKLWNLGFSGADFFIAAIGSGLEIFGKYEKIIDYNDNVIKADVLLEEIRHVATDFAVKKILDEGFSSEISPLTRFYVLWRWNYQEAKVHFDDARKLAQSLGINLEQEWNKGFIKKEKQFIRILGPKERSKKELEESKELIDILHQILLLWEKGDKEKLMEIFLTPIARSEVFYRVAEAISQSLDIESKEKKLLDGFLSIRESLEEKLKPTPKKQDKLDNFL